MKFALAKTTLWFATGLVPFFVVADSLLQNITFQHRPNGGVKGAAYFISNDPTSNYLFAADIGADAKLTLRKAYYTGGKGAPGAGSVILFSQGAVVSTPHRTRHLNVVVAVNAGSNTVTAFKINSNDPSDLKILGKPVYSGGDLPVSVAINNAGNTVCALNGGTINGVSCFRLDSRKGLIPLPNTTRSLNFRTALAGTPLTASDVVFTEDGKKLIAAIKGSPADATNNPGFIAIWDINEDSSLSTEYRRMIGGVLIFSLTQVPGRNVFIGADIITSVDIYDLDALARNGLTQARTFSIPGQIALCWSGYSNVTNNFYLVDAGTPSIDEVHFNADLSGNVIAIHQLDKYDGAKDISINHVNGKDRLYQLASNATAIEVFTIQGPGKLERIQKLNVGRLINEVGFPFDAQNNLGMATFII